MTRRTDRDGPRGASLGAHPERRLGYQLWQGGRRYVEALRRGLAERGHGGLTTAHINLVPFLAIAGTRAGDIVERTGLSKQAVAKSLGELEAAGYVERRAGKGDRREKRVAFTARGRRLLADGETVRGEIEQRCLHDLPTLEREALSAALERVLDRLS